MRRPPTDGVVLPLHVYRHQHAGFDGYRVYIKRGATVVQRYYSARQHGSLAAALSAARKALPALVREAGPPLSTRPGARCVHRGRVRAQSGVRGVSQCRNTWVATWYDPPMQPNRRYCGTGASGLALAIKTRRAAMRAILQSLPT